MWKFIIIFIISLSAFDNAFAGQPDGIGEFIVTDINDKDSTLNKVRMFPPKFLPNRKRKTYRNKGM